MEIQKALDELKALKIDYDLDLGINFEKAQAEIDQSLQLQQTGVSGMLCGSFDLDSKTSSATKCKCGREKWEHPKPRN